jgi:CheY-like chemotaxis protein
VRLVAVSAQHSPSFRAAKTAIGFNATLGKPFRKDDLLQLLASVHRVPAEAD